MSEVRSTVKAQSPRDSQQPSEAESTALMPYLAADEEIETKSTKNSKVKSMVMEGPKRSMCRRPCESTAVSTLARRAMKKMMRA
jgi:hypothetical protein